MTRRPPLLPRPARASLVENVSRRGFLKGLVGAGGLVLGIRLLPACAAPAGDGTRAAAAAVGPQPFGVYLAISGDGTVFVWAHRSEMGTGIRTSLPMVLADELEADWSRVRLVQADGDERYGDQNTDGSRSIRDFLEPLRIAGASARRMLETAASRRWRVASDECRAGGHAVLHVPTGRRLGYGELAAEAAALPVPEPETLVLKDRKDWRYIGRDVPIPDGNDLVTGAASFGLDVTLPGMKVATIERCPVLGGRARSVDASAALAVPGVERVIELPASAPPHGFQALGGVAVLAKDTWSALQGRRALRIEWDEGPNATYSSSAYGADLLASARAPGRVVRSRGDADAALAAAARRIEADYELPHLAHASMEPPCALARVTADGCEAWAPTQNPQAARAQLAQSLGLPREKVTVHVTLLGGGFGRKSKPDYVVEAALLAREVGAPVQVVWTREDDLRHDYYHAVSAVHLEAGLDAAGRPVAWLQRSAFPSIGSTFDPRARAPGDGELGLGFTDVPFDVPNLRCEAGPAEAHVRIGWFRSVCNVFHAFALGSFADELAAAAGRDSLEYLLELLGTPRHLDLAAEGAQYSNYGESLERHPLDVGRLRRVLEVAARKAGWGGALPAGSGRGLAAHRSFGTYVAVVAEVAVAEDGTLAIPRLDLAVDCGLAVHPDRVRAQMEGSAVFGASLALFGEITAENGRIVQSNFHDYKLARMKDAPKEIHVHLVEGGALPGGVGEPGVPPVAPALCNALFAATGKRIRKLPIARHDLSRA